MTALQLVNIYDYERHARKVLPLHVYDYYSSGAGHEFTLELNKSSFKNFRIRPRFLRDVSVRNVSTTALGCSVKFPIGVSPTAMQKMAHPNGECDNAKGAGEAGTIFIMSTISTSSIEDVAAAAPNTQKWFQLYICKDRLITESLVHRAERAGFKALVLTVDAPVFGIRYADKRNKFKLPPHLTMANFTGENATRINTSQSGSGLNEYVDWMFDQTLTWEDVKWLKSITKLPVVLKGVLTAEDAVIGADLGVAAIMVSNHGARQVDNVPSSLEALPEIVAAVGDRCEVYLDGGIRSGTDAYIALALGARMVFIGRPALWGLTHNGNTGVKTVLEMLAEELETTMILTGCATIKDINKDMVVSASYYSKF